MKFSDLPILFGPNFTDLTFLVLDSAGNNLRITGADLVAMANPTPTPSPTPTPTPTTTVSVGSIPVLASPNFNDLTFMVLDSLGNTRRVTGADVAAMANPVPFATDVKFSEFPVATTPDFNNLVVVGLATGANTQFPGSAFVNKVNSVSGPNVSLDVYNIPFAVEEAPDDAILYGRLSNTWAAIPPADVPPATDYDIINGIPTVPPINPNAIVQNALTGIFYQWTPGSSSSGGYYFSGSDYATMTTFTTLGDPAIYGHVSYESTGNGNVISGFPISEFGRVGGNYHIGVIKNLVISDSSPMQGTTVPISSGTIPIPINMVSGSVQLDYKHLSNAGTVNILYRAAPLGIFLSTVANILTIGTNANSLVVDGIAYTGFALVNGRHYHIEFKTTAGTLDTVNSTAGINNLNISVVN